jgi:predicted permease
MKSFLRDLRYGFRTLRKTPVFTLFAVVSLGLGIGANTTVFTVINTLLVHPLPVGDSSGLAALYGTDSKGRKQPLSYPDFEDYASGQQSFRGMAAFTPPVPMALEGKAGPERVFAEFVTARYFETLGLSPAAGRFFLPGEASEPGSAPVAILSYSAWQGRFGGSREVIGRTLELNSTVFNVIGVAPKNFLGVSAIFGPDVWLPATMCERAVPDEFRSALSDRGKPLFHAIGRLKGDFSRQRAEANLGTISAALAREYPATDEGHAISVRPITDELFSNAGGESGITFGSAVLLAIVALILAIACSNVANLLLARSAARRHEIAVRLAIGSSRGRLIRQLLTESVLLSLLSLLAGLVVGEAGCRFLWSFVPAEVVQNMVAPRLDAAVLLFAFLVSLVTAFLFGLAPAFRASRTDVVSALKEDTRTAGRERRTVSATNALLVGQVAFSLVCLIIAALFFRSIERAYHINPGFATDHLALIMTNPGADHSETRAREFYRAARERVSSLPGVTSVSWSSGLPFWNNPSRSIVIEGTEQRKTSDRIATVVFTVDTGYFETMGIPLIAGRAFGDNDREESLPVAIVNQALAEEHWPGGGALGHRFQFAGDSIWRQVIGVVKTANYTTLGEPAQPCVYVPLRQNFSGGMTLDVRTAADPAGLLVPIEREIRGFEPNMQFDARTGAKLIDQVLWGARVGVSLLGVFGSLALVLASVGLYGVMAYSVTRRTKEIGVRMALGASRAGVLRLILRDGMLLVGCGVAVGLGASLLAGRVLSRMLFGISAADPVSLAAASAVLLAVALAACYLPARAAARVDPMAALRSM